MKKARLVIFIIVTALTGCVRTVPCVNQYITPAFVGFELSELDTLVVREYKKDNNFLTLIDTAMVITENAVLSKGSSNYTTFVLLNNISGEEKFIFPDHDWQIYVPALNLVISLSNFDSPQTEHECTLGGDLCPPCPNPINSFLQNGQHVIPQYGKIPFTGGDFYLTYINR